MKPYDLLFFIILISILFRKRYHLFVIAGIASLVLSLINFAVLVSFREPSDVLSYVGFGAIRMSFATAQHLTWYAAAFFSSFIFVSLLKEVKEKK